MKRIGSFQWALAGSDLVVLGRRSHELAPNVRGDQRLVISRGAAGLKQHANVWWWNPARVIWAKVGRELLPRGGEVAVPGGQAVFDLFLEIGFDAFHLSRAHGVKLPGGRALFSGCDTGLSAEAALAGAGLRVSKKIVLDATQGRRHERLARGSRDRRCAGRKSVSRVELISSPPLIE
jgi:hypothetical protein